MATKEITLNPDEDGRVSFSFTPTEARIHTVGINGLSGSFEALPELATLYGFVEDKSQPGVYLEGVLAELNGRTTYTAKVDDVPRYTFEDMEYGAYTISFSKEGYETATYPVTIAVSRQEFSIKLVPLIMPNIELISYDWEVGQPYEPSTEHSCLITVQNISPEAYTYELAIIMPGASCRTNVTLQPNEVYTWDGRILMPRQEGVFNARLYVNTVPPSAYSEVFELGTVEVRSPIPPPEEAEFSVAITDVEILPPGEGPGWRRTDWEVTIHYAVTNHSDFNAYAGIMYYTNGVPRTLRPTQTARPIPAGATVTDPIYPARFVSSQPTSFTFKICVSSLPTMVHVDCDERLINLGM